MDELMQEIYLSLIIINTTSITIYQTLLIQRMGDLNPRDLLNQTIFKIVTINQTRSILLIDSSKNRTSDISLSKIHFTN
jgi:hypothetical protein